MVTYFIKYICLKKHPQLIHLYKCNKVYEKLCNVHDPIKKN